MTSVILLNSDYSFLNVIDWKRAIKLIVLEKVEVIKSEKKNINQDICYPKILRLVKLIKLIYSNKIIYTKNNVFIRDNYTCKYCQKRITKPTIDHIIPKSRGGEDSFLNCVCSCIECNMKKNNRTPEEANMSIKGKKPHNPTVMEFLYKRAERFNVDITKFF